ncbi:MAG TPA: hypothetical protein VFM35_01315 [Candidatus Binatia bacterium]|nr:hypothetical protein [Candidatus Binatia bacterium]
MGKRITLKAIEVNLYSMQSIDFVHTVSGTLAGRYPRMYGATCPVEGR